MLFWLLILFVVLIMGLVIWLFSTAGDRENELWSQVKVGDSLFVKSNTISIEFYKKGKSKLFEWEQREIKYAREDTIDFIQVNRVPEKYFFKNKTSFIGICTGIDSTVTQSGDRWLMVEPTHEITHPPKPENPYDYDARKWDDPESTYEGYPLSKEYYVSLSDVVLSNNNKAYQ